jgi:hypothetical protein
VVLPLALFKPHLNRSACSIWCKTGHTHEMLHKPNVLNPRMSFKGCWKVEIFLSRRPTHEMCLATIQMTRLTVIPMYGRIAFLVARQPPCPTL